MKFVVVAACLLAPLTPALAQKADPDKLCYQVGATAGVLMERRQEGVSISTVLARIARSDASIQPSVRQMAMKAYKQPVYGTLDGQQRAIKSFQSGCQFDCFKQFSEPKSKR